ncbi:pathogenesis-related protein PRMS-like [Oryza brachyantha]|uniref:pathogenesis-related protein PRMS-like n=1 Tax=Oryza brachyantha TaxID=4533 RepID=UPI001AD959E2|nr:pathogenesis-related protein PRMS-like [Oryza brachyantha]
MSSSFSRLAALLSMLALVAHLHDASASPATATQFLSAVNGVRRQAGEPPLAWSAAAGLRAEHHVGWLRSSGGCDPAKMDRDPTGIVAGSAQTYFFGTGRVAAADVVGAWAGERRWYDAGARACVAGKQCGDYEILVGAATKQLGCALAVCSSGNTVAVCEYYPYIN